MTSYTRYFPLVGLFLVIVYLIVAMTPPSDPSNGLKLQEAAQLPVNDQGRVKPLDTMARMTLMILNGKQTYVDEFGNTGPAIKWALDVMTSETRNLEKWRQADDANSRTKAILNNPTANVKAFEIRDPAILADFEAAPVSTRFSYAELAVGQKFKRFFENPTTKEAVTNIYAFRKWKDEHDREPNAAEMKRDGIKELNPEEQDRVLLVESLTAYMQNVAFITPYKVFRIENEQVVSDLGLEPRRGFRYSFDEFVPRLGTLLAASERAHKINERDRNAYEAHVIETANHVNLYLALANLERLPLVPPMLPDGKWWSLTDALEASSPDTKNPHGDLVNKGDSRLFDKRAAQAWKNILDAYSIYDPAAGPGDQNNARAILVFNKSVDDYQEILNDSPARETRGAPFETFYNNFAPFYQCTILYVVVFLLSVGSWLGLRDVLVLRTAYWIMLLTLALHTWAIIARIWLSGRPPVTNLYSSAVFIGWGSVCIAAVLEGYYHNGFAVPAGSSLGFITSLIAQYLAMDGDTIGMMRAVLDTNFWLATHVTAVTIGYTATLVAGYLGMLWIGLGVFTPALDKTTSKTLYNMIYGVVCFAMMFSFIGTVLGGIWADQSWGRFWGWDPKENGALLIVIWNAIILHARWGGMAKERGVAVLAVFGNIVTGWSWFGTNMLGVGLHAYGFMNGAQEVLIAFDLKFLAFIGLGLMPLRYWRSFGATWQIPGFKPPVLPNNPLPAMGGIGSPPSTGVSAPQESTSPGKQGRHRDR